MRIAYVIPALNTGGAEHVTTDLANAFAGAGHDVTIIAGWPAESAASLSARLDPRVALRYIQPCPGGRGRTYLRAAWWSWRHRSALDAFDVLHFHLTYGAFIGTLIGWFRRLGPPRRPLLVETYHAVGMRISRMSRWAHAQMASNRDVLVLMATDAYWSRFASRHSNLTVRTILNGTTAPDVAGIDAQTRQRYRETLGIPHSARVVGTIGMLRPDRQPTIFLPIIVELVRSLGNVHWIYAGEGAERQRVQKLVEEAGLADHVHFAGLVTDVRYPLAIMDLHFTISVGGVSGVAAIEAALAGVPVIGMQVLAGHQPDSDWIWSSDDPRAVAATALRLLQNPDQLRELGERQRQHAAARYSVERMAESYREVYERAYASEKTSTGKTDIVLRRG